ncbi:uncharacterized protein [Diadema antillarum]|uniref:uncharacterized protein n=1 Tax=Diadema antillarum TaxID=105358 RepID=UPI003A8A85B7
MTCRAMELRSADESLLVRAQLILCVLHIVFYDQGSANACGGNITLSPSHSHENLVYDGSNSCTSCSWSVSSTFSGIVRATFVSLRIPGNDEMEIRETARDKSVVVISNIFIPLDPVFVTLPNTMTLTFDKCGGNSRQTSMEVDFQYLDDVLAAVSDDHLLAGGGTFSLSASLPSLMLHSSDLSSVTTDPVVDLNWYFFAPNPTDWLRVDLISMDAGSGPQINIYDTNDDAGTWVSMTGSLPPTTSTTWYSYGELVWLHYWVRSGHTLGTGMVVNISLADSFFLSGNGSVLPSCNPEVTLEESRSLKVATPFFGNTVSDVRYQCTMKFRSNSAQRAKLEFLAYDHDGQMSVYTTEGEETISLATTEGAVIATDYQFPMTSISPNEELTVDIFKSRNDLETGVLMEGSAIGQFLPDSVPISSLGISATLKDSSTTAVLTTPGYPSLPTGRIYVKWIIDNVDTHADIELVFADFDIRDQDELVVSIMESTNPVWQGGGSTLPANISIVENTRRMTIELDSNSGTALRGIHFNATSVLRSASCVDGPCQNGATCQDVSPGVINCNCPAEYEGDTCSFLQDACLSEPCQNGATCTTFETGYRCTCVDGYTGHDCDSDINECEMDVCQNGGTCTNVDGGFSCYCTQGFSGDTCETDIDECATITCQNGGTCSNSFGSFTCFCVPGFIGTVCEEDVDECDTDTRICENGGTCDNTNGSFRCICPKEYQGDNCENDVNECETPICQHDGECINFIGNFTCDCTSTGFEGRFCQEDVNECDDDVCLNGGKCTNTVGSFSCQCAYGYAGDTCQYPDIDECDLDVCLNGATCINYIGDYECICAARFTGRNCQEEVSQNENDVLVIALSVSLVFVVIVLVVVVIVIHRCKNKKTTPALEPTVSHQCSQHRYEDIRETRPNLPPRSPSRPSYFEVEMDPRSDTTNLHTDLPPPYSQYVNESLQHEERDQNATPAATCPTIGQTEPHYESHIRSNEAPCRQISVISSNSTGDHHHYNVIT